MTRLTSPRDERGEVTSTVLVMPVVLLIVLLVIQAGLSLHARSLVAEVARREGRVVEVSDPGYDNDACSRISGALRSEPSIVTVSVTRVDSVSGRPNSCPSTGAVVITVRATPACVLPFPGPCAPIVRSFYIADEWSRKPWE